MKTMKAMKKNAKPMKAMIFQKKTKKAMKAMKPKKAMKAMKPMKAMKAMKNIASNAMSSARWMSKPSFRILFEAGQDKIITVDVKASDTVDQLKAKIHANVGGCGVISTSNLVVRLGQPRMGNTLADYGLKKYSIVTQAPVFYGMWGEGEQGVN
jgi:hypothetical protein